MTDEAAKEDWLRQEIRASRELLVTLMNWGVGVLTVVEIILFYARQDITAHLRDLGRLHEDALLPLPQWLLGTLFLVLIATIFVRYADHLAKHYEMYRLQLTSMTPTYSEIAEPIPVRRPAHQYLYYAFPIFDIALWGLYFAGEQIGGRFDLVW